ncbi:MAG: LysM domain-containing protein [Parvularculaceae bacterium]
MAEFVRNRRLAAVGAVAAIVVLSGCASAPPPQRPVAYGGPYTGAERLYEREKIVDIRDQMRGRFIDDVSDVVPGMPFVRQQPIATAFYGVEGARLAHLIYDDGTAERLDGVCEQHVTLRLGETMDDIAQYCDAPLKGLIAYNPMVRHARDVFAGEAIDLGPYSRLAATNLSTFSDTWYIPQEGDTIETIAARFDTSIEAISILNPDLVLKFELPYDAFVRIPVKAPAGAPAPARDITNTVEPSSAYGSTPGYGSTGEADAQAPYRLTPSKKPGLSSEAAPNLLKVDRLAVNPGGRVTVSGSSLPPNRDVTIYRGTNGRDMEAVSTVRTDSEGNFSQSVRVRKSSDLGGVIFKATVDENGKSLQSPRVGVHGIDASADPEEEEFDDEDY